MRHRSINKRKIRSYNVIAQKYVAERVFTLLRFSHNEVKTETKKEIWERILADGKTIGIIEWWEKGGIIHKPKVPLEIIIVSEV